MGDEHPTTRVAAVSSTLRDEPGGSSKHVRADAMALEVACVTQHRTQPASGGVEMTSHARAPVVPSGAAPGRRRAARGCREEAFPRDPGGIDQGPWASRSCSRSTVTAVLACGVGLVTTLRGARPRRRGVGSAAR